MSEKYPRSMKRREIVDLLKMQDSTFSNWKRLYSDFPAPFRRGNYNTEDVCEFIVRNQSILRGPKTDGIISKAQEVVNYYAKKRRSSSEKDSGRPGRNPNPSPTNPDPAPDQILPQLEFRKGDAEGLTPSLIRQEDHELHNAQLVKFWTDTGNMSQANRAMDLWAKSAENLRKTKMETLKIQQLEGTLIPVALAQDFLMKNIMPVQRELLRLPLTLAPELEFLDKVEIEEILDKAIRRILKKISLKFDEDED